MSDTPSPPQEEEETSAPPTRRARPAHVLRAGAIELAIWRTVLDGKHGPFPRYEMTIGTLYRRDDTWKQARHVRGREGAAETALLFQRAHAWITADEIAFRQSSDALATAGRGAPVPFTRENAVNVARAIALGAWAPALEGFAVKDVETIPAVSGRARCRACKAVLPTGLLTLRFRVIAPGWADLFWVHRTAEECATA